MFIDQSSNKRIAKNTLFLYLRMIVLMVIGLFTSRVMLQALGIENYGINNVVGGFLGMFGIITSSMTNAVSRFITVELVHDNTERQQKVFATTVSVMIAMGVLMVLVIETVGLWFLNTNLNIPGYRMHAAQWVLHCAAIGTFFGLISVPYNSAIVAHEKMSAFAYMTIIDAIFKLLICYIINISPFDKLITYAILGLIIAQFMQWLYFRYCRSYFLECRYDFSFKKDLFKEIWGFAGWNFFGQTAWILNNQGINMLMNVFFGVFVNAARGVAQQVNSTVQGFVSNFMTALNPQITKSYAAGNKQTAFVLACRGARFSFYLMLFLALPIMIEAKQILTLWLVSPPEQSDVFCVWTIISTLTLLLGNTLVTLQNAHGNIKHYQLVITLWGFAPFPLTWIAFKLGAPVVWSYYIFVGVYYWLIFVRFYLVNQSTGIPFKMYIWGVVCRTHLVAFLSSIIPLLLFFSMTPSLLRLMYVCICSVLSTSIVIIYVGMDKAERSKITTFVSNTINKCFHR